MRARYRFQVTAVERHHAGAVLVTLGGSFVPWARPQATVRDGVDCYDGTLDELRVSVPMDEAPRVGDVVTLTVEVKETSVLVGGDGE